MGVFWREVVIRARKGAGRDGKRCEVFSRDGATTFFVATSCRCGRKLNLAALIEEDFEVATHVGFEESVFGFRRLPGRRTGVGLG